MTNNEFSEKLYALLQTQYKIDKANENYYASQDRGWITKKIETQNEQDKIFRELLEAFRDK